MSLAIKAARAGAPRIGPGGAMGDPGLFGFLGKVGKGILGGAAGLLTGGPGGAIAGAAAGLGIGRATVTRPAVVPRTFQATNGARCGPGQIRLGGKCIGPIGAAPPGGRPFITPAGPEPGMDVACPSGFHPNKTSYFLRDGTFVAKGSKCVRNRRRNPMNPRALDRAMGRISSAKKASKKLGRISIRKPCPCPKR